MTPVTAPPAPPTPPAPVVVNSARRMDVRLTIDVRVEGGGAKLFDGPLRVASNGNTYVRREQSEPPEKPCERPYAGGNATSGLSLTLAPSHAAIGTDGTPISVTVRWTRPSGASCVARQGGRVVELTDTVLFVPGREIVLTGDGGLRVTLRPR